MSGLKTKEITLDNYTDVYDYYERVSINKAAAKLAHLALAGVYNPNVSSEPGALDIITNKLEAQEPLILAANHVHYIDHLVAGAALHKQLELKPLIGNTFILAKAPYFVSPISRFVNEQMGCVPVFRPQDIADNDDVSKFNGIGAANLELANMSVKKLASGQNMFLFPEGTRNNGDWSRVMKIRAIIGKIACDAWKQEIPVSIVPIAITYNGDARKNWRHANVHLGNILEPPFTRPNQVIKHLQSELQKSVDVSLAA